MEAMGGGETKLSPVDCRKLLVDGTELVDEEPMSDEAGYGEGIVEGYCILAEDWVYDKPSADWGLWLGLLWG